MVHGNSLLCLHQALLSYNKIEMIDNKISTGFSPSSTP
jgi:hypothetical protein